MCNSIFIDDKTLPKAKDGDEYEVTIKGVYRTDEDGVRKFDVESVEGRDVADPDAEESDCGCAGDHDMDSNEALEIFMIETKNKKR